MPSSGTSLKFLTRCPCCEYSLEGLPSEHVCPECGFPFADSTRVFCHVLKGPLGKPLLLMVIVPSGVLLLLAVWMLRRGLDVFGLFLAPPAAGLLATWLSMNRWRHNKLILSDHGIIVIDKRQLPRTIDWANISAVDWSSVTGAIKVRGNDGGTFLRLPRSFLGVKSESKRFALAAQRALDSRRTKAKSLSSE